jgi:hypothetical protein
VTRTVDEIWQFTLIPGSDAMNNNQHQKTARLTSCDDPIVIVMAPNHYPQDGNQQHKYPST